MKRNKKPDFASLLNRISDITDELAAKLLIETYRSSDDIFQALTEGKGFTEDEIESIQQFQSFMSMNAVIKTLVGLVSAILETYGDDDNYEKEMIELSRDLTYCIKQKLSKQFPDLCQVSKAEYNSQIN